MMQNDKIINLKTLEILDDNTEYIIVDGLMAKTIVKLNKKGYKTKYCCSGHFLIHQKYLNTECDLKYLEEVKNDASLEIETIKDDNFDYWEDCKYCDIYIMFNSNFNFPVMPKGFEMTENNTIRHTINYFDENNNRRKPKEIFNEIEKYNKILEDWANDLPDIN